MHRTLKFFPNFHIIYVKPSYAEIVLTSQQNLITFTNTCQKLLAYMVLFSRWLFKTNIGNESLAWNSEKYRTIALSCFHKSSARSPSNACDAERQISLESKTCDTCHRLLTRENISPRRKSVISTTHPAYLFLFRSYPTVIVFF